MADNGLAGIIVWSSNNSHSKTCRIMGSTIIGVSNGNAEIPKIIYGNIETRGLVTPSTDGLYVENVKFYNFDKNSTAIASCAVCWHVLKNITLKNYNWYISTTCNNLHFIISHISSFDANLVCN